MKFDAATAGDVHFHQVSIPIPPAGDQAEKAVTVLGPLRGNRRRHRAAERVPGRRPRRLAKLKGLVAVPASAGGQPTLPMSIVLDAEPLARCIAAVAKPEEQAKAAMMGQELQKTPGLNT